MWVLPTSKLVVVRDLVKLLAAIFFIVFLPRIALGETQITYALVRENGSELLPSSRLDLKPDDLGFAGAKLGLSDNQTTGNFLGLKFSDTIFAGNAEEALAEIDSRYSEGERYFIVSVSKEVLLKAADKYKDALIFNATAANNSLRNDNCRANLLHIAPSYMMLTDAAAQYLMWKKWQKWFLIFGSHEEDKELAESYRKSAAKFGAKIVDEKEFTDTGGARRTDTGFTQVQKQIPLFTQRAQPHDVVIGADANDVFASYLPYRTWEARPVAGSAGLIPTTWNAAHEAWGANQIQNRFEELANRYARPEDYQFWLAVRVLGEAVVRTMSDDPKVVRDYLLSDKFEIAAFKGSKLSFRDWNGQLRQPILLSDGRLTISVSPQQGYLHQNSILDTLGTDRPETTCTKFGSNQ